MIQFLRKIISRIHYNKYSFKGNTFKHKIKNKEIHLKKESVLLQEKISSIINKILMIILLNKIFFKTDKAYKLKIIKVIINNKMIISISKSKVPVRSMKILEILNK
jgi:uncharacterized membrane protein